MLTPVLFPTVCFQTCCVLFLQGNTGNPAKITVDPTANLYQHLVQSRASAHGPDIHSVRNRNHQTTRV
jgi:hypothetical protein